MYVHTKFVVQKSQEMDEGSVKTETGVSPDALPTSYINNMANVKETSSDSLPIIDPLYNPSSETVIVTNDNDKHATTQDWLMAVKREAPMKDEEDGDEEDAGTSSFENLSPLSDDAQGSTKGFRKVLGSVMLQN